MTTFTGNALALDALREFEAGQAGHLDVGDQDVGIEPLQFAPRAFAVGGGAQHFDIALHAQQRGERAAQHCLVFGDEDADHGGVGKAGMRGTLADHRRRLATDIRMPAVIPSVRLRQRIVVGRQRHARLTCGPCPCRLRCAGGRTASIRSRIPDRPLPGTMAPPRPSSAMRSTASPDSMPKLTCAFRARARRWMLVAASRTVIASALSTPGGSALPENASSSR